MDLTDWTLSHRSLVLYGNCNSTKNLFGGQMLAWMDVAAGMYAQCQMRCSQVVTRQMGAVDFKVPVPLGWVCTVYARTAKIGRTSLVIDLLVTRKDPGTDTEEEVTRSQAIMVAVENGPDGQLVKKVWNPE